MVRARRGHLLLCVLHLFLPADRHEWLHAVRLLLPLFHGQGPPWASSSMRIAFISSCRQA